MHPEPVGHHAEGGGEEGFAQRHLHLTALGQSGKYLLRFGWISYRQRERKALESGLSSAAAIGRKHRRAADAESRVHYFVRMGGAVGALLGAVLEAHQHQHFRAQCLLVEVKSFFTTSVKEHV